MPNIPVTINSLLPTYNSFPTATLFAFTSGLIAEEDDDGGDDGGCCEDVEKNKSWDCLAINIRLMGEDRVILAALQDMRCIRDCYRSVRHR